MYRKYGECKYDPCNNPKCSLIHKGANVKDGTARAFDAKSDQGNFNKNSSKPFIKKINKAGSIPILCRDGNECIYKFITCKFCHSEEEINILKDKQNLRKQFFEEKKQNKLAKSKVQDQSASVGSASADSVNSDSANADSAIILKSLCINGVPLQIVKDEIDKLHMLSEKFNEKLSDNTVINAIILNYQVELDSSIKNLELFYNQVENMASMANTADVEPNAEAEV